MPPSACCVAYLLFNFIMVKNVYSCAPVQVCIGAGKQSADSSCAARVSLPRAGRVAGAREMSATPQAPYRRRRSAKRLKILTHTPNISNIRGRRCGGGGQRVPSHHGTVRGVCRRSLWRVNHLRPAPWPCRSFSKKMRTLTEQNSGLPDPHGMILGVLSMYKHRPCDAPGSHSLICSSKKVDSDSVGAYRRHLCGRSWLQPD